MARTLPALNQRKPRPETLGAAQYSSPIISSTNTSRTGHLTIDHVVITAPPSPNAVPARSARGPVNTTMIALPVRSSISVTVSASLSGVTFQTGRPSGRSYTALDARMKAPTYPDADHSAVSSPTIASTPPVPPLCASCVTASRRMSRAGPGAKSPTLSRSLSVTRCPMTPRRETTTSSAGNSDSTP